MGKKESKAQRIVRQAREALELEKGGGGDGDGGGVSTTIDATTTTTSNSSRSRQKGGDSGTKRPREEGARTGADVPSRSQGDGHDTGRSKRTRGAGGVEMQGTSRVGGKKKESKAERFRRQMEEESGAAGDSAKSVEDAEATGGGTLEDEVAGPGSDGAEQGGGEGDAAVDQSVGGLWALGAVGREAARAAQEKARAARRAQREVVPKWMEAPLDVAAFPAALPVAALPLSPALLGNFAHETLFPVQAAVRPA
jgi:hypothetical protein